MSANDGIKLKPCPFCGERSITVVFNPTEGVDMSGMYIASCDTCGGASGFRYTRSECVEAWNRRAAQ